MIPGGLAGRIAGSVNQTSLTRLAEYCHYNAIILAHEKLSPKFGTWIR